MCVCERERERERDTESDSSGGERGEVAAMSYEPLALQEVHTRAVGQG